MQSAARAVLASLEVDVQVEGIPPRRGLLVANHLSYFDIAVLSTVVPCCFVARADVRHWPLFGALARWGGTIFLDRASMASASATAAEMSARLELEIPVVLFPEGTSTDGSEVLRFRSRLFQPATELGVPVTAAAIGYSVGKNIAEREVCFYGDQALVSHLWTVLRLPRFVARVRFGEAQRYGDARVAAFQTHDEVTALRERAGLVLNARE